MWLLNNILLKNDYVKEETKAEIKRAIETNENVSTTHKSLWDAMKAVIRGKFMSLQAYLKNQKKKEKKKKNSPKSAEGKKIIKIRAEYNKKKNTTQKLIQHRIGSLKIF